MIVMRQRIVGGKAVFEPGEVWSHKWAVKGRLLAGDCDGFVIDEFGGRVGVFLRDGEERKLVAVFADEPEAEDFVRRMQR